MSILGRNLVLFIYFLFIAIWAIVAVMMFNFPAAALKSANYQLIEPVVGGVGSNNSASTDYQVRTSGALDGVGTSSDTSAQIEAGHQTTGNPALSFGIVNADVAFGTFSPTTTATTTASFEVSDYTSYGYIVQIFGTPPTNDGYTIKPLATNSTSQVGVNQYGINLVANTEPPLQVGTSQAPASTSTRSHR